MKLPEDCFLSKIENVLQLKLGLCVVKNNEDGMGIISYIDVVNEIIKVVGHKQKFIENINDWQILNKIL